MTEDRRSFASVTTHPMAKLEEQLDAAMTEDAVRHVGEALKERIDALGEPEKKRARRIYQAAMNRVRKENG